MGRKPPTVIGDGRTPIVNMAGDDDDDGDDDDEAPKVSAPADRSLDKITDEAMEQAYAAMEQAQVEEERRRRNIATTVSKHLDEVVKPDNSQPHLQAPLTLTLTQL